MSIQSLQHPVRDVVVGLDGSDSSHLSLPWAADLAHLHNARLVLVHCEPDGHPHLTPHEMRTFLDNCRSTVRIYHPDLEVQIGEHPGSSAEALLAASGPAMVTVLAPGARADAHRNVLGTAVLEMASGGASRSVVVRAALGGQALGGQLTGTTGPIVVGVDGSPDSEQALGFAFAEASLRRLTLLAIRCHDDASESSDSAGAMRPQQSRDQLSTLLSEQLAPWSKKYPEVLIHQVVRDGAPTPTLLSEAQGARKNGVAAMLVVGSRGRLARSGPTLGSTSAAVLEQAGCPVAVVHASDSA
ncbi:universal stress protein [Nakamurella antarctica]|uniref:Universal stress protein n=1 Tax=Nakamurella antarctica TaxID=1902245 RepID=A0A3G8ZIL8_9ACTN|nr:universal stress protein [Nakamurella antarctica]AZI57209.1 universal stress protein [Nakamurella antarctica]